MNLGHILGPRARARKDRQETASERARQTQLRTAAGRRLGGRDSEMQPTRSAEPSAPIFTTQPKASTPPPPPQTPNAENRGFRFLHLWKLWNHGCLSVQHRPSVRSAASVSIIGV